MDKVIKFPTEVYQRANARLKEYLVTNQADIDTVVKGIIPIIEEELESHMTTGFADFIENKVKSFLTAPFSRLIQ